MITLTKYFSRENSLFYAHVWNEANRDHFDQYIAETNIKNMVFLLNDLGVLEVYYDLDEIDAFFGSIASKVTDNSSILDTVTEDFYSYWDKLTPYLLQEKGIESLAELKEYYQNWVRWWAPMAYIFVIPDQEEIPEKLKARALKIREETQEYADEGDRVFIDFIQEQYPRYAEVAALFLPQETFEIKDLDKDAVSDIRKRVDGCALATIDGKSIFGLFDEIQAKLAANNLVLEQPQQESNEIMGLAASPGTVKGRVRLVLRKSDLSSVEDDEIMVTYATSPEYVPAMKKCAAIVTDEGGVVSHAAIVARELELPCVVGTKVATKVLKDGMKVEVDANKGVVKMLGKVGET